MTNITATALTAREQARQDNGRFGAQERTEAEVVLTVRPGDVQEPLSAVDTKLFFVTAFEDIDAESAIIAETGVKILASDNDEQREELYVIDATAGGRQHGAAEALAVMLSHVNEVKDIDTKAEQLLDGRANGFRMEEQVGWAGPGEFSALERLQIVDTLRNRADDMHRAADEVEAVEMPSDIVAHYRGRAEALNEAATALSGQE